MKHLPNQTKHDFELVKEPGSLDLTGFNGFHPSKGFHGLRCCHRLSQDDFPVYAGCLAGTANEFRIVIHYVQSTSIIYLGDPQIIHLMGC